MVFRIFRWTFTAILILLATNIGYSSVAAADKPCDKLEKLIKAGQAPIFGSGDIEKELLDNADQCLLKLEDILHTADDWGKVYTAALGLALAGTEEAVDILAHKGDRQLAAFATSATGRTSDIAFLCQTLEGDDWSAEEAAALSLSVLRNRDCLDKLQAAAQQGREASVFAVAQLARNMPPPLAAWPQPDDETFINYVLDYGIPQANKRAPFLDEDRKRVRWQEQGKWRSRTASKADAKLPNITLKFIWAANSERLLVQVGLHYGPLDGKGYDIFLRHMDNEWQVYGLLSTWIS